MAEKKTCKGKAAPAKKAAQKKAAPKKAPAPKPKPAAPEKKPAPKIPNKKATKSIASAFRKASGAYLESLSGLFNALALRGEMVSKTAAKNLENAKSFDSALTEWLKRKGY